MWKVFLENILWSYFQWVLSDRTEMQGKGALPHIAEGPKGTDDTWAVITGTVLVSLPAASPCSGEIHQNSHICPPIPRCSDSGFIRANPHQKGTWESMKRSNPGLTFQPYEQAWLGKISPQEVWSMPTLVHIWGWLLPPSCQTTTRPSAHFSPVLTAASLPKPPLVCLEVCHVITTLKEQQSLDMVKWKIKEYWDWKACIPFHAVNWSQETLCNKTTLKTL